MDFRIDHDGDDGYRLIGELDMATAQELRPPLEAALRDGRDVRLDLSGLTFIDSSGIHAIADLAGRSANGHRILIERPTASVMKVLRLVGADRFPNLEIHAPGSPR